MATFAIVPGAGESAANWELVTAALRERGHEAIAVELPSDDDSARFGDYADAVIAAVGDRREIVVVAHSLGGFTAPLVCERTGVELLVLVAGMIPRPGESAGEWWTSTGYEDAYREDAARIGHDGSEIAVFLHDVPDPLARQALERGRDQSGTPMAEPWPLERWPEVPTRYLLCRDDRMFPAAWLRGLVGERLGIVPDEIDGGHCPYLSRPAELAERLEAYWRGR